MNPELAQHAYEQIDNYILRILLYVFAAVIISLAGAVGVLYRENRRNMAEAMWRNREQTEALTQVVDALSAIRGEIQALKNDIFSHFLK